MSSRPIRSRRAALRGTKIAAVGTLIALLAFGGTAASVQAETATPTPIDSATVVAPTTEQPGPSAVEDEAVETPAAEDTQEAVSTAPADSESTETEDSTADTDSDTSDGENSDEAQLPSESERSSAARAPGDGVLSITLSQETGTGPFDADDTAGHDSSATNNIIRTNDTVTYTVGLRYEGEDQTNPTIEFTLPQGQELVSLPPFCLSGSSVTPALDAPEVPVTTTSYQSLLTQTVVCRVANQAQGSSLDYKFVAKVRPEMPNGHVLDSFSVTATTDQVDTPVQLSPAIVNTVSAKANFDVSKRGSSTNEETGPMYSRNNPCSFDSTKSCRTFQYPLTVSTPSGGKGSSPLVSPITLVDDISPATIFGATVWADAIAQAGSEAAALVKYAPRLAGCTGPLDLWGSIPWASIDGGSNSNNAVRDSGNMACDQPGGLGTPVQITFTDTDTTAYTVPTLAGNNTALPAGTGYVISRQINLEVPYDAVLDLGIAGSDGSSWTLPMENTFTDIEMTDIGGSANEGEVLANNNRVNQFALQVGNGFNKWFSSPLGKVGNTPASVYNPGFSAWEGPAGSSYTRDGNSVVLPGQNVLSNLFFSSDGSVPNSGTQFSRTYFGCDVWDDSQLGLTPGNYAGGTVQNSRPSNGEAAWISLFINGNSGTEPLSDLRNLTIEYSSGPAGAAGTSDCTTGTWYSSPSAVPGAVLDAQGVYSGVNRIRVSFSSDYTGDQGWFFVNLAIGQTVRSTGLNTGDKIGNWAGYKQVAGLTDMAGILADTSSNYTASTYNPADHTSSWGDRLTVGAVASRISKFVKNPTTNVFTDTAVPQYTSGSNVEYRLNPTLTADVSAGTMAQVYVEDCLPRYQVFVSSHRDGSGDPITPVTVSGTAPADADLTCAPNETYVKWDLGLNEVNQPIDPIVYSVEILDTVRNANYTNTARVSSPGDPSAAELRTDTAQIQIVTPTGIKIAKTVDKPTVEVNGAGVTNPRSFVWTIDFANIDSPTEVSDVDVIDVLPASGIGDSDFEGSLRLDSATVVDGSGIQILYTRTASTSLAVDPDNASNQAVGSTVWCDAVSGGAVVRGAGTAADCPTAASEVTGLRFLRAGDFEPTDSLTVDVAMTPIGNAEGDVYENSTAGRVVGVTQPVGPATREVDVVASTIGDFVWLDLNQDGIQDTGEPGVEGLPVTLSGTDVDGNAVSLTTTTDADGAYLFENLASGTYVVTFDAAWVAANNYDFTLLGAGSDQGLDSDADPSTGAAAEITLGIDEDNLDIDAGLVQPVGGLIINKALTGTGTALASETYAFQVICTSRGVEVYNDEVVLTRTGDELALTSDRIDNLPIGAICVITETENGGSDETPAPVTVTITENDDDNTVVAAIVNEYSAGTISASKVADGDFADHDDVVDLEFTLFVTCQIETEGDSGTVIGTVYSGSVVLTAGEEKTLTDDNGNEVLLPLGTHCFVEETDDGGADESAVNFDSYDNAAVVTAGTPEELQALLVTATNTFSEDPDGGQDPFEPTPSPTPPVTTTPPLAFTGTTVGAIALIAGLLLVMGAVAFVIARRRQSKRS